MKKIIQIFTLIIVMANVAKAQIPNGNFEKWSSTEANSWVSTNGLMLYSNPQSIFKTTDSHSDSFACEINTIHVATKPPSAQIPDYTASLFLGKLINFRPIMGIPYTSRPDKLVFWYKYMPKGTDTAVALCTLTRWNSTASKTDTIGLGFVYIKDSTSTYTKIETNVTYLDSKAPDTLIILFASSTITASQAGSKLTIDDVDMIGGNTGITPKETTELEIYPNPAKNLINLNLNKFDENVLITITDMQGKYIYTKTYNGAANTTIQTSSFAPGIYIINAISDKKALTYKFIIE